MRGKGIGKEGGGNAGRGGGMVNRGSRFLNVGTENRLRRGGGEGSQQSMGDSYDEGVEPYDTSSRRGSVGQEVRRLESRGQGQRPGRRQDNRVQDTVTGQSNVETVTVQVAGDNSQAARMEVEGSTNEFEVGRRLMEISAKMREGVERIAARLNIQGIGTEELKEAMKEGLSNMMEAVEQVMNLVGDGVQQERRDNLASQEKVDRLEVKVKETEARLEADRSGRDRMARKESVYQMKEKITMVNRQLKYVDIDFGRQTSNRREMIEKTISYMREDVNISDRRRLDVIIRRTKFVVLAKGTVERPLEDQRIHNAPILLEFKSEADKVEVEDIMKSVNWFPVFHWPAECVEFVKGARAAVREEGYSEQQNFIKIRPEERDGKLQIKAEVKERRQGAKFRLVAVWEVPPADKDMWGSNIFNYRRFGARRGGE